MDRRSFALSLGLHAAIIAVLIGLWRSEPPAEIKLPQVTVVFEPGGAGAEGGGADQQPASGAGNMASPPAAADTSAAEPPSTATPEAAPEPPSSAAPAAETEPTPPQAEPPPVAMPAPAAVAETAPGAPHPPRKPPRPRPPAPQAVAAAPPPPPEPLPAPEPAPVAPPQPKTAPGSSPAETAAAMPGSGIAGPGQGLAQTGAGRGVFGNDPHAGDDWLDAARRRLLRFMENPNEGRAHPQYGTVWLSITVAHDGRVLAASVEESSGVALLDESALKMVHDATPLPPLPDSVTAASVTFKIPAKYEPGFFERLFR